MRYRDDLVLEQAFGDGTIDGGGVGVGARQFNGFAIGAGLARKKCGSIDRIVGDAAWNAFGAKCADESIARHAERGFVDQENERVDDFAGDAWIARNSA